MRFLEFDCDGIDVEISGGNCCVEDDICSGWYRFADRGDEDVA